MRMILTLSVILFLATGCDDVTVEGPKIEVKYHFSSHDGFIEHYLPLQDDHGGIKSWVPSEDKDCRGGKIFTLADGHEATFCPANGDETLFK